MKSNFKMAACAVIALAFAACRPQAPAAVPRTSDGSDVQRLVAILDYIAGDYGGAVENGQITNADEYAEQVRFTEDAQSIGRALAADRPAETPAADGSDALVRELGTLVSLVAAKADLAIVAAQCHTLKGAVVDRFGLRTAPTGRPNRARGQELYVQSCAVCHGPQGNGDTPRARELNPPPANFREADTRARLSPYRAYNALTFGVSGTSMPSFEALSPEDRWSVAFYVLSLAHETGGGEALRAALPLTDLAWLSDAEILADLRERRHPAPARGLAYLRTTAPYEEPSVASGLGETRARLRRATAAYAAGARPEADRMVMDAYLQGFEPLEARLSTRDAERTAGVERGFLALRTAMRDGASAENVRSLGRSLEDRLASLSEDDPSVFPFFAALLIYLREGVEAALLVGALLAAVRKLGHESAARDVHRGWMAAIPAGVLTWWALDHLITLSSAQRELVEAVTALVAAAVLFWVSFWLISKAESRRWTDYLKSSVSASFERRSRFLLWTMAFLAVYREAAETVLFTQALLLDAGSASHQVWAGALTGLAVVGLLAALMRNTVMRLPIGPFFAVSGLLLCLLAVSFAGAGLYELIGAGYLTPRPVPFPEVAAIGVHADLSILLVQFTILAIIGVAGVATLRRARA
jgi:high-affinity iron transporter